MPAATGPFWDCPEWETPIYYRRWQSPRLKHGANCNKDNFFGLDLSASLNLSQLCEGNEKRSSKQGLWSRLRVIT